MSKNKKQTRKSVAFPVGGGGGEGGEGRGGEGYRVLVLAVGGVGAEGLGGGFDWVGGTVSWSWPGVRWGQRDWVGGWIGEGVPCPGPGWGGGRVGGTVLVLTGGRGGAGEGTLSESWSYYIRGR